MDSYYCLVVFEQIYDITLKEGRELFILWKNRGLLSGGSVKSCAVRMYERNGFTEAADLKYVKVMRKYLG